MRILRWKEKYDQIPEDTKDPGLLKAKKDASKRRSRRATARRSTGARPSSSSSRRAPPGKLYSKGPLPWRLLAYLLKVSPEVEKIRSVVRKRLMDEPRIEAGRSSSNRMLLTLHEKGFVDARSAAARYSDRRGGRQQAGADSRQGRHATRDRRRRDRWLHVARRDVPPDYQPAHRDADARARQAARLPRIHPLYGAFLIDQLGIANRDERIQSFESVLEMPRPLLKYVRVPFDLPPGPLQTEKLDPELIAGADRPRSRRRRRRGGGRRGVVPWDERPPTLAEKLRLLFDATTPRSATSPRKRSGPPARCCTTAATSTSTSRRKDLIKQEGIIFRHLLRLILLSEEFAQLTPPGIDGGDVEGRAEGHRRPADRELPGGGPDQHRGDDQEGARGRRGGRRGAREGRHATAPATAPPSANRRRKTPSGRGL